MKIVMLAGMSNSSDIVYNSINKEIGIDYVIMEHGVSKKALLKRRIKKIGFLKVLGQIMFELFIVKRLKRKSKKRINEIIQNNNLSTETSYRNSEKITFVETINDKETENLLKKINPDVVIVNGTGIIKKHILKACNAIFINMHAGITPKYRGVHGGYWALANNDKENCGVTVHIVDTGIDTGGIIYQERIYPNNKDNFVTYPYLQLSEGIKLEIKALNDIQNNNLITHSNDLPSHLWSHPTLFQYLKNKVK